MGSTFVGLTLTVAVKRGSHNIVRVLPVSGKCDPVDEIDTVRPSQYPLINCRLDLLRLIIAVNSLVQLPNF